MGAARRRSRGHGPARLDGTLPRATVASKVMEFRKDGWTGNGPFHSRPHGKRKRAGPKLEAGPEASAERSEGTMEARRGRDIRTAGQGGSMRSTTARPAIAPWPETPSMECSTARTCSILGQHGIPHLTLYTSRKQYGQLPQMRRG